jgi:tetratricopeptide (TPR) repeat protein
MRRSPISVICALLLAGLLSHAENTPDLDRRFQAAVAQYEAGHFADAATTLESLLPQVPNSFEVHELLGLAYSAQSLEERANEHLEKAVRLNPGSAPARTNLGTNLVRLGKLASAASHFKKAIELDSRNFDASHNLAELYIRGGKIAEAIAPLENAQRINPASYDNGYDLCLAYLEIGRLNDARQQVQKLMKQKNAAELHNLLGQIEEKDQRFVAAENEYETAAHIDPSESNLFDWGSELLLHRTLDPAVEVFRQATTRYPNSQRLAIGLGMALYSRGNYDDAVKALLKAADLNPSDPRCYLFLSKAYDSSPGQAENVIEHFRRFAELQPQNARALYYYAMSMWKGRRAPGQGQDLGPIEILLKKSIALDSNLAEPHLQLGNLYSDQNKFADAIPEYQKAVESNPDLADIHYRLGQAYVHAGQKGRAREQLELYQKLRTEHLAELDRQRAEIRQFVYAEKDAAGGKQ